MGLGNSALTLLVHIWPTRGIGHQSCWLARLRKWGQMYPTSMESEAALSEAYEVNAANEDPPPERHEQHPRAPRSKLGPPTKSRLATLLKAHRNNLGLSQQSLARKIGVRASHVALLENARRRPSLALIGRLAAALSVDGKELLELAYPEVRALVSPVPKRRTKVNPSWQRLVKNTALLARYRVTQQELEALEHLGMLGGELTAKRLLAILLLVRDMP
jgi:transcriptional regulator with XRE-family HTH domain